LAATSKRIPLADATIEVRLAQLDLDADRVDYYASLLSNDEQFRANRFHLERDRRRFIVARGILRVLLASRLGTTPPEVAFSYAKNGKPLVADYPPQIHFNISHSKERVLYAISNRCALGVDIEYMNRDIDYDSLAERFFSRREHAELQLIPEADRKRAFFACWTRKEAVIKATGDGLSLPLSRFEVTVAPDGVPRVIGFAAATQRVSGWVLHAADVGDDYVAVVAAYRGK